jgi:hypothetical protein
MREDKYKHIAQAVREITGYSLDDLRSRQREYDNTILVRRNF